VRAETSRAVVVLDGCDALSQDSLEEHLALELRTLGLSQVEARVLIHCADSRVAIEIEQASGRYPVAAQVELSSTAKSARERLVALSASELLAQAEREHEGAAPKPQPKPPPPPPPVVTSPRAAPPRDQSAGPARVSHLELFAAATGSVVGSPQVRLFGGTLGTRIGFGRRWSVLLDTRFERGNSALRLADVRWSVLSGFVGTGIGGKLGALDVFGGAGVRAGWLSLAASATAPDQGLSLTAPWAGISVPARLAFDVGGFARPFLGGEAGWVFLPVRGKVDDGSVLVSQRGVWISGTVGLSVQL
jgi:hypothetical protein